MSEQTPELRWAPIEPKPKNKGRIWLTVGLVIAVLAIVGALLFFLLPRGDAPAPGASGSPVPATESAAPGGPDESPDPATTPPPPVDPTIDVFRELVKGWLTDAPGGFAIIERSETEDALAVVDTLEQDAMRLSDAQPPSSIDPQWRAGVGVYAQRLADLRASITSSGDTAGALAAAREAITSLNTIIGL